MLLGWAYLLSSLWFANVTLRYHLPANFPVFTRWALAVALSYPISAWFSLWCMAFLGGTSLLASTVLPTAFHLIIGAIYMSRQEARDLEYETFLLKADKPSLRARNKAVYDYPVLFVAIVAALVFGTLYQHHDMSREGENYMTGGSVYADLPMHATLISSIAYGANSDKPFWDYDFPVYSGEKMAYPFLIEVQSVALMSGGWEMPEAVWIPSTFIVSSLFALLCAFASGFARAGNYNPGMWACLAVVFAGGVGFIDLFQDWQRLGHFPVESDYVLYISHNPRKMSFWFSFVAHILLPQRTSMSGYPLFLGTLVLLRYAINYAIENHSAIYRGTNVKSFMPMSVLEGGSDHDAYGNTSNSSSSPSKAASSPLFKFDFIKILPLTPYRLQLLRFFVLAGVMAALSPMCLLHVYVGLVLICGTYVATYPALFNYWVVMAVIAAVGGIPQLFSFMGRVERAGTGFLDFGLVWNEAPEAVPEWLQNTSTLYKAVMWWPSTLGVFAVIALGGVAFLSNQQLGEYSGHLAVLVMGTVIKFQPWMFDNTKLLYLWHFCGAAVVGLFLERIRKFFWRNPLMMIIGTAIIIAIVVPMTAAGFASMYREFREHHVLFGRPEREIATWVYDNVPHNAVVVSSPDHRGPVTCLSGRTVILGYQGWLHSHGINYWERESEWRSIWLAQSPQMEQSLVKHNIEYIITGPSWHNPHANDKELEKKFPRLFDNGQFIVYKVDLNKLRGSN